MSTIRNPVEWGADGIKLSASVLKETLNNRAIDPSIAEPDVRRITVSDLKQALIAGWQDFEAYRTDVLFLCLIYPLAGLAVVTFTYNSNLLPLVFPFVSGFALLGPFAAAGLYEMSRRRTQGVTVSWLDSFGVFRSPAFPAIAKLALMMTVLFLIWLAAAMGTYHLIFGADMPTGVKAYVSDVFTTPRGWALIVVGSGIGFLFALIALAVSVVSFPLLLDRPVGIPTAVRTSARAVARNPAVMPVWGLVVAAGLVLGAIPALLGMIVVMPVLGHATWHLYRKVVV